jgi:hypothetical protein
VSHSRSHVPYDFVIWWIIHTICGCAIGILIYVLPIVTIIVIEIGLHIESHLILDTWQLWAIAAVPIYGAFVGYLQWDRLLLVLFSRRQWIITSAFSAVLGLASFLLAMDILPSPLRLQTNGDRTVSDTWFLTLLGLSLIIGTGIALPNWYILRKTAYANRLFITILGSVFAAFICAFVFDGLVEFYYLTPYEFFCLGPVFVALAMGIMLRKILEQKQVIQPTWDKKI